jgi:hypothetical protein
MICGLPGSGKSHWIEQHKSEFEERVIPDFFKDALGHDSGGGLKFWQAQYYPELIVNLRSGKDCCIADVEFCRLEVRDAAEKLLREAVPGLIIEWIAFTNTPSTCEANIRHDHANKGRSLGHRLDGLRRLAGPIYTLPHNATILPVSHASVAKP